MFPHNERHWMAQPDYASFARVLPESNITRATELAALCLVDVYVDGRCALAALINAPTERKRFLDHDERYEKAYLDVTGPDGQRHLYLIINSGIAPGDQHPDGYILDIGKSIGSLIRGHGVTGYGVLYPAHMTHVSLGRDSELQLRPMADELVPRHRRPDISKRDIKLGKINRIIGLRYGTERVSALIDQLGAEVFFRLFPEEQWREPRTPDSPPPYLQAHEDIPRPADDPMWPWVLHEMNRFQTAYAAFIQTYGTNVTPDSGHYLN